MPDITYHLASCSCDECWLARDLAEQDAADRIAALTMAMADDYPTPPAHPSLSNSREIIERHLDYLIGRSAADVTTKTAIRRLWSAMRLLFSGAEEDA